jgi:hypothetical protein
VLYFDIAIIANILVSVFLSVFLGFFIYSNYKMFIIAKSKRTDERLAPTTAARSTDERRKKRILNLKNISACSLAVGCFFFCYSPQIIYSVLRLASGVSSFDKQILLLSLWSNTLTSMNSTFNCLIFFWKNSILRREGIKIMHAFRVRVIT